MEYTSAEANKLLKELETRIDSLKSREKKSSFFNAASTEDPETLRPAYEFEETQKQLEALEKDVRIIKHAVNMFNVTHTLPGYDDMTIDQALVYLPQLTGKVKKLKEMASALPRERVTDSYYGRNIIDYVIANYDIAAAERAYHEEQEKLMKLQLALDAANSDEKMELEIDCI